MRGDVVRPKLSLRVKIERALEGFQLDGKPIRVEYTYGDSDEDHLVIQYQDSYTRRSEIWWWKKEELRTIWRDGPHITKKELWVRDSELAHELAKLLHPVGIKVVQK